ncbi:MAG: hypothetical protein RLY97_905, partial [Pseudomonadota bacterium]
MKKSGKDKLHSKLDAQKGMKASGSVMKKNRRFAVVILGMHRSGTSALSRMLSLLGCDLPRSLMPETSANPSGYWESSAIMQLNDEILASTGSNWKDWTKINGGWYESPLIGEYLNKGSQIIKDEFNNSTLFVMKDPRNCRLARYWFDVLHAENINKLVVLMIRNPIEVNSSLKLRDSMNPDLGNLLWLRHVLDAEFQSRGEKRFTTTYDKLIDNWQNVASQMQQSFAMSWPRFSQLAGVEIAEFINVEAKHHISDSQKLLS